MQKIIFITAGLMLFGCATAQRVTAQPATQPISTALSTDSVLDALHDRGEGLKEFSANVTLSEIDQSTGDAPTRSGRVLYQAISPSNARLRVIFDKRTLNDKSKDEKVEYLLENGWLTDRDYRRKNEVKRQVLRPGEQINLLKLGEGPFPLPIGQDKQDVYKMFDVTLQTRGESDPANMTHIKLSPKPETRFARKFKAIDVWVDMNSKMPMRIDTTDLNETVIRSTTLTDVKVNPNPPMKDADFAMSPIEGWTQHEEPFAD